MKQKRSIAKQRGQITSEVILGLVKDARANYDDGDPYVLTAREVAALMGVSVDRARAEIQRLIAAKKVEAGLTKDVERMDKVTQPVAAYRFLVV